MKINLRKTECLAFILVFLLLACKQPDSTAQSGSSRASTNASTTSSSTGTTTTTSSSSSTIQAIQIITKADSTGSFDSVTTPVSGGTSVKAQRYYGLDGSLITTSNIPTWFSEARLFLTSSRTGAGAATFTDGNTPCAYFDSTSTDTNPDSSGYYTIDGYTPTLSTTGSDLDQCAGVTATESAQLGFYLKVDRRFMNSTDKLNVIVKMKMLDEPNVAPTPSSCVVGGSFDPIACSNGFFTLSMRSAPLAATQNYFILFPSSKALDLLSESLIVPINTDSGISTISIDRVKGGAIIYGVTVIRLQ